MAQHAQNTPGASHAQHDKIRTLSRFNEPKITAGKPLSQPQSPICTGEAIHRRKRSNTTQSLSWVVLMTDGWCCAYCETVVEPDQEKLSSKGGMKLTCPNCGNSDYQPPAGGAIAR